MIKKKINSLFLILFCASFSLSFGQKSSDSATLIQNVKLTNIDTADIVEINEAREIMINHFIKKANTKGSLLYNLIKQEYIDPLDNGKNGYKRETRYPDKISANNIITSFINKDLGYSHNLNSLNKNLFDCGELRQYDFLVTIPIYDIHHAGHEIQSFSIIEHFVVDTEWVADLNWKEVSPKKTVYQFYNPQKINIAYSNLRGTGDLEK
jgi:hypothetical protein